MHGDGHSSTYHDIKALLDTLENDLIESESENANASATVRTALERLWVLSRDSSVAHLLSSEHAFNILAKLGLSTITYYNDEIACLALRCFSNILYLQPSSRQCFVERNYTPALIRKLKDSTLETQFICSRILLLLTYETNIDFEAVAEHSQLHSIISQALVHHADGSTLLSSGFLSDDVRTTRSAALSELLKFIFNLAQTWPSFVSAVSTCLPQLLVLLLHERTTDSNQLRPPVGQIINVLLIMDHSVSTANFDRPHVERLICLLTWGIKALDRTQIESLLSPLIALLLKTYPLLSLPNQEYMQTCLLPTDLERAKPLGQSSTTFSDLIRLSTDCGNTNLRELIPSLMFEMSGRDPWKLVKNVGYGYASGYLINNGFDVPQNSELSIDGSDTVEGNAINPVTGQYLANEEQDHGAEMTEDEKLREAERLFVLFERLKATGVVDVQNPVDSAVTTGRLEELDETEF